MIINIIILHSIRESLNLKEYTETEWTLMYNRNRCRSLVRYLLYNRGSKMALNYYTNQFNY